LRYGATPSAAASADEIAHLKLRYKRPEEGTSAASRLLERNIWKRDVKSDVASASPAWRMAASVAAFGQLLTGGRYTGTFDYTAVEQLAAGAGDDRFGERAEFRQLVRVAKSLSEPVGRVEKAVEAGG
jgi:Ca-activated chloride channel family protein